MNRVITRKEIIEQLGPLRLDFKSFCQDYYVFAGIDGFKNDVSLFLRYDAIRTASADSFLFLGEFATLSKEYVRVMIISPELEIIYED